jgi:TolB protein
VNKKLVSLALCALFVPLANAQQSAPSPAAAEEIYIDIGRAGTKKLKMAIPAFGNIAPQSTGANNSPSEGDKQSFADKLSDIFSFVGAFEFIPASGFLSKGSVASKPVDYEEWISLGTDAVILGKVENGSKPGKLSFQLRLYDVKKKKQLVGKAYTDIDKKRVDYVLRRFADLCMQAFTGEIGIFNTKLAFVGAKKQGDFKQLYISNIDGTELQQLTDNGSINMSPSWSPDGTKLTFTSFKDGKAEIYVYSLLTRRIGRLTSNSPGNNSGSSWHPEGKTIAFAGAVNGKTSIFTMNSLDGSARKQFIAGSGLEVEPSYSPDGQKIAFASGRFGNPHIFVRELSSGQDTRLTFAGWYNSSPTWRPDGKKIVFAGYDREIDRYDLFLVNPDGRQMERLTLDQGDNEKPSFSPDGRFMAFQSNRVNSGKGKQKGYRIFVMNKDGGDQRSLKIPLYDVTMPAWSPRLQAEVE